MKTEYYVERVLKAMQFPEKPEDDFMRRASQAIRDASAEASRKYGHGRDKLRQRQELVSQEGKKQEDAARRELTGKPLQSALSQIVSMINVQIRTQ